MLISINRTLQTKYFFRQKQVKEHVKLESYLFWKFFSFHIFSNGNQGNTKRQVLDV